MPVSKVVLGIGNVGSEYDKTRHNIGFEVIDMLSIGSKQFSLEHSIASVVAIGGEETLLIKPQTYVNRSGVAAAEALKEFNLSEDDLIVAVDDFHIPLGSLRYRKGGSAGGHNGLKSLIECCGADFVRLRLGIGPLPEDSSVVDFVLGRFSNDESLEAIDMVAVAAESLKCYIENGLREAMNRYNGQQSKPLLGN